MSTDPQSSAAPIAMRYVAPVEAGSVYVTGTLVMTDQELSRYTSTRYRLCGAYAETGRVEHANWHREPDRIEVAWNFSTGSIDAKQLRTVAVVPEDTPGAFPAWINGLPRYEVSRTVRDNFDAPCGSRIVGFDTELPAEDEDPDEDYRDRWRLPLAMWDRCEHFCERRRNYRWAPEGQPGGYFEGPCDCKVPGRRDTDSPF